MQRECSTASVIFLLKVHASESNPEEASDSPQVRDVLQNNWPVIGKHMAMEVKERRENHSRLKETTDRIMKPVYLGTADETSEEPADKAVTRCSCKLPGSCSQMA